MNRQPRHIYVIYSLIIIFVLAIFNYIASNFNRSGTDAIIEEKVFMLLALDIFMIILLIRLTVQRLHDINYSGWYSLILFIPLVNLILFGILFLQDGTKGSNRYGPDPKGREQIKKTIISSDTNFDKKLEILDSSLNSGVITDEEYTIKFEVLQRAQKNFEERMVKEELANVKRYKIDELWRANLINQEEYNLKIQQLDREAINLNFTLNEFNLDTSVYYVEKSKTHGPFTLKQVFFKVKFNGLNPQSLVKQIDDSSYTYRIKNLIDNVK